jgi:hypothetical protein
LWFFAETEIDLYQIFPEQATQKKVMFAEVEAVTVASGEGAAQHRCLRCCGCAIRPC